MAVAYVVVVAEVVLSWEDVLRSFAETVSVLTPVTESLIHFTPRGMRSDRVMSSLLQNKIDPFITSVIARLQEEGYEAYVVGGAVRDMGGESSIIEENFVRALAMSRGNPMKLFNRPIAVTFLAIAVLSFCTSLYKALKKQREKAAREAAKA